MKKTILFTLMMLVSIVASAKDIRTVVLTTDPIMHCENCEKKITENLRFVSGIKEIKACSKSQSVIITYDADKTSPEKFIASLKKIGYTATEKTADAKPACHKECDGKKACDGKHCDKMEGKHCDKKDGECCKKEQKACDKKDGECCKKEGECCKEKMQEQTKAGLVKNTSAKKVKVTQKSAKLTTDPQSAKVAEGAKLQKKVTSTKTTAKTIKTDAQTGATKKK